MSSPWESVPRETALQLLVTESLSSWSAQALTSTAPEGPLEAMLVLELLRGSSSV